MMFDIFRLYVSSLPMVESRHRKVFGFTLVELLVVIGIIAVLIGILIPSALQARGLAKSLRCKSQLRQIGVAVQLYVNGNAGYLSYSTTGTYWTWPNPVTGFDEFIHITTSTRKKIYWGASYAPYILPAAIFNATGPDAGHKVLLSAYGIWHCPSTVSYYPTSSIPDSEYPVSYGINGYIASVTMAGRPVYFKCSRFHNTANLIFCHDTFAPVISQQAWALSNWGSGENLSDFRLGGNVYPVRQTGVSEYYRHLHRCNILWIDGHVTGEYESLGADIPYTAYNPF